MSTANAPPAERSRRRRRGCVVALALAGSLSLAVPDALGDQRLTAVVHDQYGTATVTIAQGETVSFANSDIDYHNVTAATNGADGNPLFSSATIGGGQGAAVAGTQYLTAGSYGFYCTVHPFMTGTLVVTSAGTPLPRPGQTPPPAAAPPPPAAAPPAHHHKHHHHRHGHHSNRTNHSHSHRHRR